MKNTDQAVPSIADDKIVGADAIGAFIGEPARKVYRLVEKGELPGVFFVGRHIWGFRSQIAAGLRARASGKAA